MQGQEIEKIHFADARGKRLLAALSGGSDSVALLLLLLRRREADELEIVAAHFHHGIRGTAADADADYCRKLCAGFGVQLIEGKGDVPALAGARGVGIETAAREARYAFLHQARADCGADWIALAHHRDDQAETVLMHLLRGAGLDGACGMARLEGALYRPLLDVPKSALRQFLQRAGIPWREDASNAQADNPRNALRRKVLPEIRKIYPGAEAALARHAKLVRREREYLDIQAKNFLQRSLERGPWGCRLTLSAADRSTENEALLCRAWRILLPSLNAEQTEALLRLAQSVRGTIDLPHGRRAEKTNGRLYLLNGQRAPEQELPLPHSGLVKWQGMMGIRVERGSFLPEAENSRTEVFPPEALRDAVVRARREGDRFHPLGGPGDRLLSDYLIDRKVDRPLRDWLPLVAVGRRILWVCGLGMSETAKLRGGEASAVRLTIVPLPESGVEEHP